MCVVQHTSLSLLPWQVNSYIKKIFDTYVEYEKRFQRTSGWMFNVVGSNFRQDSEMRFLVINSNEELL